MKYFVKIIKMMTIKLRIILNSLLFTFLILLLIGIEINREIHKFFGVIFIILIALHIISHWNWFKSLPKMLKKLK